MQTKKRTRVSQVLSILMYTWGSRNSVYTALWLLTHNYINNLNDNKNILLCLIITRGNGFFLLYQRYLQLKNYSINKLTGQLTNHFNVPYVRLRIFLYLEKLTTKQTRQEHVLYKINFDFDRKSLSLHDEIILNPLRHLSFLRYFKQRVQKYS